LIASLLSAATLTNAYDFEVFLRGDVGERNGIYTWREAKNYCMSLKDGWQLVIIDSEEKQTKVREAFEAAGAEDGDAAWIGFENDDGWAANGANGFQTLDIYGNRASYFNYAPGEPNNKYGNPREERGEDCVKMRFDGTWEDALCGRKHTKKTRGRKGIFNSFICEPKPLEAGLECIASSVPPTNENYEVVPATEISFNQAREACQAKGGQWDLVVFESDEELEYVKKLINCLPEAFWVGYREMNGNAIDILNKPATIEMPWETNKANGDPDEPSSKDEECVRMRRGKMNDAICTRTWSGAMRDNVGMGYVCERHASLVPTQAPKEMTNAARLSTCEENNWGIEPFNVRPGCPTPLYCEAEVQVLDAWMKKNSNNKNVYGVAIKVNLSSVLMSKSIGKGYSVLVRFPKTMPKASFQVWTIHFFNFYEGGTEVLLHSKWWQDNSGFDPELNSFVLVVENMDVPAHPNVLAYSGRQMRHSCFDPSMHANQRSGGKSAQSEIRQLAQDKYDGVTLDNVQKITMNRGQLKSVKAIGGKKKDTL
jgi:hypothetical protein